MFLLQFLWGFQNCLCFSCSLKTLGGDRIWKPKYATSQESQKREILRWILKYFDEMAIYQCFMRMKEVNKLVLSNNGSMISVFVDLTCTIYIIVYYDTYISVIIGLISKLQTAISWKVQQLETYSKRKKYSVSDAEHDNVEKNWIWKFFSTSQKIHIYIIIINTFRPLQRGLEGL